MTKVYICDDEHIWIEQIEAAVNAFMVSSDWEMEVLCRAAGPDELLDCLQQHKTLSGIYFLDIDLKSKINGIELGARIRNLDPEAALIFITTHDELVMDTFRLKLQATDYLLKDQGDLGAQISNTLQALESHYKNIVKRGSSSRIQLFTGSSYRFIAKEDIYFAESQKDMHKLLIHMRSEVFTAAMPLKSLQKQLGDSFVLCRRGCLINPLHVTVLDLAARQIEFDNKETCSCSYRAWKAVAERVRA